MKKIIVLLLFGLLVMGCAAKFQHEYIGDTHRDIDIKKLSLMLNDSLRRPSLKNKEIGILTFANLNDLEKVDPLGRHLQEKLSHAMFDLGFRIIEIRLGDNIRFQPLVGELSLTRIKEKLKRTEFKEIEALILGTYIDAGDYVYVNSKMIELANSTVRASGEIKIRKGDYLSKLLDFGDDDPAVRDDVYERFPIAGDKSR
jgi:hypothetical protein